MLPFPRKLIVASIAVAALILLCDTSIALAQLRQRVSKQPQLSSQPAVPVATHYQSGGIKIASRQNDSHEQLPRPIVGSSLDLPHAPAPHAAIAHTTDRLPTRAVFIVDFSQSMAFASAGVESRHTVAQWALYDLLDAVPDGMSTAIISLQHDASVMRPLAPLYPEQKLDLRRSIMKLQPVGDCELSDGFVVANGLLAGEPGEITCAVVVTDGDDCNPSVAVGVASQLAQANCLHLTVIGVAAAEPVTGDRKALAQAGKGTAAFVTLCKELPAALAGPISRFQCCRVAAEHIAHKWCSDLTHCRENEAELAGCVACLKRDLHNLQCKYKELECDLERSEECRKSLADQLDDAKTEIDGLQYYVHMLWMALLVLLVAVPVLVCALIVASARLQHCNRERNRLQTQVDCLSAELKDCEADKACCAKANANLQQRICELEADKACCAKTNAALQQQVCDLEAELACCGKTNVNLQQRICDLEAELRCCERNYCAAGTKAKQLGKQVEQLTRDNFQLQTWLSSCQTGKAVAEEKAFGAASKCCCPSPAVVYGPVVTPTSPTTTPTTSTTCATPTTAAPTCGAPPAVGGAVGGNGCAPAVGTSSAAPNAAPIASDPIASHSAGAAADGAATAAAAADAEAAAEADAMAIA
jgi:hypothetical protein